MKVEIRGNQFPTKSETISKIRSLASRFPRFAICVKKKISKISKISLACEREFHKQELSVINQELTEIFFLNSNYQQLNRNYQQFARLRAENLLDLQDFARLRAGVSQTGIISNQPGINRNIFFKQQLPAIEQELSAIRSLASGKSTRSTRFRSLASRRKKITGDKTLI